MAVRLPKSRAWLGFPAILCALGACQAQTEGSPEGVSSAGAAGQASAGSNGLSPEQVLASPACQAPAPGRAPLRRLSNAEYKNTVIDLLGASPETEALLGRVTAGFPSETESLGFRNNADYLAVSTLVAGAYADAAEQLLDPIASSSALLPCTPTAGAELDCARKFIATFGKLAFRRPLTSEESSRYEALFQKAQSTGDFKSAVRSTAYAFLQSPHFLYRPEFGANAGSAPSSPPSPYEMASRLSYLFWQSMPDAALFDAADHGQLQTRAEVEAQARRMLRDAKASRLLEYFEQWLGTDVLPTTFTRDETLYPNLDKNLVSLLREESRAFVSDVLSRPSGSLSELFTAPYTFANESLAKHYGFSGITGSSFVKVAAPGRAGVLTQGMLLAHDKPTRTSIVRRGLKIRLDVLCQLVPAPPPDVKLTLDTSSTDHLSQRARLEQHRINPSCSACHDLMDPIGVAFEGFDAVGRPRAADEHGAALDTSSALGRTRDADGPIESPVTLGERLSQSEEVKACYVTKSFRFFYGRDVAPVDACSIAQLARSFKGNAYSLSELLIALTQTDAFLYLPLRTPGAIE